MKDRKECMLETVFIVWKCSTEKRERERERERERQREREREQILHCLFQSFSFTLSLLALSFNLSQCLGFYLSLLSITFLSNKHCLKHTFFSILHSGSPIQFVS